MYERVAEASGTSISDFGYGRALSMGINSLPILQKGVTSANKFIRYPSKAINWMASPGAASTEFGATVGGNVLPAIVDLEYPGEDAPFSEKALYYTLSTGLPIAGSLIGAGTVNFPTALKTSLNSDMMLKPATKEFVKQNSKKEVINFFPDKKIPSSGELGKIAPGNTKVKMINLKKEDIVDFDKASMLRGWVNNKFNLMENQSIIKSTGENLNLDEGVTSRILKNVRNKTDNLIYPKIDEVIENAYYSGFRPTDLKHDKKVIGQNIYHSGISSNMPETQKLYSVKFYVDQPLQNNVKPEFAGHKVTKVKTGSQRHWTKPLANGVKTPKEPVSNLTLAQIRGDVNKNLPNISQLYDIADPFELKTLDDLTNMVLEKGIETAGNLENLFFLRNGIDEKIRLSTKGKYNIFENWTLKKMRNEIDDIIKNEMKKR